MIVAKDFTLQRGKAKGDIVITGKAKVMDDLRILITYAISRRNRGGWDPEMLKESMRGYSIWFRDLAEQIKEMTIEFHENKDDDNFREAVKAINISCPSLECSETEGVEKLCDYATDFLRSLRDLTVRYVGDDGWTSLNDRIRSFLNVAVSTGSDQAEILEKMGENLSRKQDEEPEENQLSAMREILDRAQEDIISMNM